MTADRWHGILQQGGAVDLTARSKWLLTGPDRVRYLNGQVTQDVRLARPGAAVYACVTDVKGRICGDIFIHQTEDGEGLLLDAEAALREELGARLERYLVADEVEIADVTDDWRITHHFGPAAAGVSGVAVERLGMPGVDVWSKAAAGSSPGGEGLLSADEAETLRILQAVPGHPNELNADVFPPEAALEEKAMSFTKGCYIGQEILSRIRTTRKMPRELVAWEVLAGGGPVQPGAPLALPGADGSETGRVTSAVMHPLTGRACGLAYVKLGSVPKDSRLLVEMNLASIRRLIPVPSV